MIEPVFDADGVTLYFGDCLDILPTLVQPVDAIIADLPYQTTRETWDRKIDPKLLWHLYHGLMRPTTPALVFGSGIFTATMMTSNPDEWKYNLVWDKEAITGHLNASKQPLRAHEDITVFYDRQPTYNPQKVYTGKKSHSRGKSGANRAERTNRHYGHYVDTEVGEQDGYQHPRSILRFKRPKMPKGMGHPTQKPVALLDWMVRSYTNPGDVVLDNVAGSATTLVAARNSGRRAIGIEIHEPFIEMAIARLESGSEEDRW